MQQVAGRLLAGLALALGFLGCPSRKPPPPAVDVTDAVLHPTLVRDWAELPPDPYPSLAVGPANVASLRASHDVFRWTPSTQRWGTLSVLQFEDTDRRRTAEGAVAAWVMGEAETVDAVVLRDFVGAPQAPTVEELLLGLGESWPPPWTLCRPQATAHADLVLALDEAGRRKLGLAPSGGEEVAWMVDHVEYLAAGLEPAAWFERKGYGGCDAMGTLLEGGKLKPPRESKNSKKPEGAAAAEPTPAPPPEPPPEPSPEPTPEPATP